MAEKEQHVSFEDTSLGIGQNPDGTFNVFPAAELAERAAARDREDQAVAHAIEQSEKGFYDTDEFEEEAAEQP